ncbi:MAG: hypothetical protein IKS00_01835 [Bacteroidales bacterium]|nr:hypothetical protein [Bacteroidales bacterium]
MADLSNQEDSAYYFVLKAETDYRQWIAPDSNALNYSIRYYQDKSDYRRLSSAYYYLGLIPVVERTMTDNAVSILNIMKKAEQLAEMTDDNNLKNKVCSALRFFNGIFRNFEEAYKYAKKEYYYAKKLSKRDEAYALLSMSSIHKGLGNRDSSEYYVMQCKRLLPEISDKDKGYVYELLAECFVGDNNDAALGYFKHSLQYNKLSATYKNMADIYYCQGDTSRWIAYCDSALTYAWTSLKLDIFDDVSHKYYEMQDYNSYKSVVDSIIKIQNLRYDEAKADKLIEIQNKFDFEKQRAYYEKLIWIFVAVLSILLAVSAIAALLYKRAIYKSRQKMLSLESDNRLLHDNLCHADGQIKEFRAQIDYLTNQNTELKAVGENTSAITESNNNVIAKLNRKVNQLSKETEGSLKLGRTIYEQMVGNASINAFKERWADCLFYFEVTFPDDTKIFKVYNSLSVSNMLFVICDDYLHKDDYQLSSIFNISVSTVRSRRSKLKGKLV